jgi:hypothetical protein
MDDPGVVILVNPNTRSAEWAFKYHRSLWHIVRPDTHGLTLCGRNPDFWDRPRILVGEAFDLERERDGLCKICARRYVPASPHAGSDGTRPPSVRT